MDYNNGYNNYNQFNNMNNNGYIQNTSDYSETIKTSEWLIMWLLMCIPCLNFILIFVWAFSQNTKPSKRNFCRAYLILMGIMLALVIILLIIMMALGVTITAINK